ncbi:MAG: hypothetical protein ACI82F_002997 [Planctomycetota bacterium]|jgi:hypothetical protein
MVAHMALVAIEEQQPAASLEAHGVLELKGDFLGRPL